MPHSLIVKCTSPFGFWHLGDSSLTQFSIVVGVGPPRCQKSFCRNKANSIDTKKKDFILVTPDSSLTRLPTIDCSLSRSSTILTCWLYISVISFITYCFSPTHPHQLLIVFSHPSQLGNLLLGGQTYHGQLRVCMIKCNINHTLRDGLGTQWVVYQ